MAKSTTQAAQSPTAIQGLGITAERERKDGLYLALTRLAGWIVEHQVLRPDAGWE